MHDFSFFPNRTKIVAEYSVVTNVFLASGYNEPMMLLKLFVVLGNFLSHLSQYSH